MLIVLLLNRLDLSHKIYLLLMRGALHWAPIGNEPNRVGRIFEFSLSCNSDVTITQILDIGTGTGREILSHRCGVTQV